MSILVDLFGTLAECGCLLYLVREEKIDRAGKLSYLAASTILILGLTQMIHLDQVYLKVMASFLTMVLVGIFTWRLPAIKTVFYTGIGFSLILFSELIINQIGIFFGVEPGYGPMIPTISVIVSKILLITLVVVIQKIISDIGKRRFSFKSLLFFLLSNIGHSVVAVCIYMNINDFRDTVYIYVFLGSSIAILAALIANVLFTEKYIKLENKEREQSATIYGLKLNARYYEDKSKEEEHIKQIYHDLKNHLLLLEGHGNREENLNENIEKLREEIRQYEDYFRTGNRILDIILKDKAKKAKQEEINMEMDIDFSGGDFLEPLDISTIFGNLLDNAIEACLYIEDKSKRYVCISGKQENHLLVISIKNSMDDRDHSGMKTNKKIISGYGLVNVANAVHRYDGEIEIHKKKGEFVVNIIIPFQQVPGNYKLADDKNKNGGFV